jgi:hypothetical protein
MNISVELLYYHVNLLLQNKIIEKLKVRDSNKFVAILTINEEVVK